MRWKREKKWEGCSEELKKIILSLEEDVGNPTSPSWSLITQG